MLSTLWLTLHGLCGSLVQFLGSRSSLVAFNIWLQIKSYLSLRSDEIQQTEREPNHDIDKEVSEYNQPNVYQLQLTTSTPSIRRLILYSGKGNDPPRGHLIRRHFKQSEHNQQYEALSYVWGDSKRMKFMELNGEKFAINEKLYIALQQIRSKTENRTLWIDAICINQADESERLHQVSLMGDIYTCAEHVISWLGPSTPNTALGMKILTFLFGDKDITSHPPWEGLQPSLLRAGLNDILQRDYFQRIWILQENALASKTTLQVGSETLTWRSGAQTHRAICRIKYAAIAPCWEAAGLNDVDMHPLLEVLEQSMMVTRMKMKKSCREVSLLDLAFDMRHRKATDRRDMLFALRNMVPEDIRERLVVDYKKPVDELYKEFFGEVQKAYLEEIKFVQAQEEERLQKIEEEREMRRNGSWGW